MFEATDGVKLSGLLYEKRLRKRPVIIFLHGTGGASVFDSRRTNVLASELMARGFAFFAFNNRGSHIVRRAGRGFGGMAFEKIRDCVYDIDGAVRELWRRGYRKIYLAGHSTGANKVAVYNARKPRNRIRAYVLLAGGDDTGLMYDQLGPGSFRKTLERAKEHIHNGDGHHFVPDSLSDVPMTWRAFYDVANPDGDYNVFPFLEARRNLRLSRKPRFHHVRTIRKPALAVYGENDEYSDDIRACVAVLADAVAERSNIEIVVMEDADHGFSGKEAELAELITGWLP